VRWLHARSARFPRKVQRMGTKAGFAIRRTRAASGSSFLDGRVVQTHLRAGRDDLLPGGGVDRNTLGQALFFPFAFRLAGDFHVSTPAAAARRCARQRSFPSRAPGFSPVPILLGSMSMENMLLSTCGYRRTFRSRSCRPRARRPAVRRSAPGPSPCARRRAGSRRMARSRLKRGSVAGLPWSSMMVFGAVARPYW